MLNAYGLPQSSLMNGIAIVVRNRTNADKQKVVTHPKFLSKIGNTKTFISTQGMFRPADKRM